MHLQTFAIMLLHNYQDCPEIVLYFGSQFAGKVAEFPTLAEQLAWCVVTQKPKDGTISKLQQRATDTVAGWKKKAGKGPTGTGFLASKIPPNYIEVSMTLSVTCRERARRVIGNFHHIFPVAQPA